jgi:hypothetical protein
MSILMASLLNSLLAGVAIGCYGGTAFAAFYAWRITKRRHAILASLALFIMFVRSIILVIRIFTGLFVPVEIPLLGALAAIVFLLVALSSKDAVWEVPESLANITETIKNTWNGRK